MKELYTGVEFHRNMGVNRYHVGDGMIPHRDDIQGNGFVIMVSLNDEFEGGNLTLHDSRGEKYVISTRVGDANIFDSGITHGVPTITSGTRYSLGQQVFTTETYPPPLLG
jgi:predicted 2-oxoglutarate/Fe(II)-dependent dioxygenase YbiX